MDTLLLILRRHDERFLHALVLRRWALLDRAMRTITHLGDTWVVVSVALALCFGVEAGSARTGYEVAFVLTLSHAGVQLLKRTITRPRPRLPIGCRSLIEAPDRFSFPSGHSAASLSLALPLAMVLPVPLATTLLALAFVVGISRCYLGVHYPGDVLAGWLLAGLAYRLADPALTWILG